MAGLGGGAGGGGLAGLLNNPFFANMAQSMMNNPAMVNMYAVTACLIKPLVYLFSCVGQAT